MIPTGIYDNQALEAFLATVFSAAGRTDDFRDLDTELFIVAVNLNTGEAVRFGDDAHNHIPISAAVQASASLPGLYPPTQIEGEYYVDGALRRTLHASVALDADVDLLLAVNPLVPFDARQYEGENSDAKASLTEGGLPLVLSQTFRALIQSRMQVAFAKYAQQYPHANMLLMEPNRNDETLFFTNVFSYASRASLCEHAYQVTRRELRERLDELQPMFAEHDITINVEILNDDERSVIDSVDHNANGGPTALGQLLSQTLDQLDGYVEER